MNLAWALEIISACLWTWPGYDDLERKPSKLQLTHIPSNSCYFLVLCNSWKGLLGGIWVAFNGKAMQTVLAKGTGHIKDMRWLLGANR